MTNSSPVQRDETAQIPSREPTLDPGLLLAWSEHVAATIVDREVKTAVSKLSADGECTEFEQAVIRELAESIAAGVVVDRITSATQQSDPLLLDEPDLERRCQRLWSLFTPPAVNGDVRSVQLPASVAQPTTNPDTQNTDTAANTQHHHTDADT
ncbi:hypothetical protein GRS48_14080 [Halorubrum sp. JWXQ-INN 858]|uniref:hypothetical protein n=1 Tax=Halorubrum sp. JWXQ-INN 858 TaxID=2690782 RepID=UPI00135BD755|nr:hypothetical protein [Halorubrum sp. JWXQ-INN 858]MWV65938.1 hypothetical protein [Halorubrum sp. JWXQ-INN 858]